MAKKPSLKEQMIHAISLLKEAGFDLDEDNVSATNKNHALDWAHHTDPEMRKNAIVALKIAVGIHGKNPVKEALTELKKTKKNEDFTFVLSLVK